MKSLDVRQKKEYNKDKLNYYQWKEEDIMRLKSVKIEGFRNIKEGEINFGNEMTSLVSENSYGKSNLMEAIDFAVDFIHSSTSARNSMMAWKQGIPLNKKTAKRDFKVDFMLEVDFQDEKYEINYGFSFVWIKNDGGRKISGEWLNARKVDGGKKYIKLISREDRPLFKSSQTGRCSSVIKIADDELIINKLMNYDDLYYMSILEEINNISVYVERHFDASSLYQKNPLVLKGEEETELMDFSDMPRMIYRLKKYHQPQFELLTDTFKQLFPNITDIEVQEFDIGQNHRISISNDAPYTISNKVYSIFVKDENLNQPLDFTSMSDGAKRVFLMLTFAVVANIQNMTLIAFEEPENSIHPSLLQGYLRVLTQLAGDCKIIVASHSPYIIEYVSTEDIYVGKPNSYGLAEFARIDAGKVKRLENDASDNGVSVGSYIFELLSGGEDEIELLNTYLEK